MLKLTELEQIPEGFFALKSARDLHTLIPNPTLLHLKGRREPALFVSILLHGNEDTGFHTIQRLLAKYQQQVLPRSLSIFFGNVEAASQGQRRLPGQPDYNRVWPGTDMQDCAETRIMAEVTGIMAERGMFASIDIHNNTGKNPHYGCITELDNRSIQLARLFANIGVYFDIPHGVQASAFAKYCPSITVECGKPGVEHGTEHAFEFVDAVLHLQELPDHPLPPHDINIYQTVVRLNLPDEVDFSFSRPDAQVQLLPDLDQYNFSELPAGTAFAETSLDTVGLQAWNDAEVDVTPEYFALDGQRVVLTQPMMPAMLTLDETIIRQDCLCYLMRRLPLETES